MTENKIIEQIRQLLRIASDRGASINERELAQRRASITVKTPGGSVRVDAPEAGE